MRRDTRSALLDAAQERFAEGGFAGTSIRDLAAAVGIKESSVYNHFPSKQAVLEAVLARVDERLATVAARFDVPIDDPQAAVAVYETIAFDHLESIANGFLDMWLRDRDVVAARRILTLEQYRTPQAGRLLRDLLVGRPLAFQSSLFGELIDRGAFRHADPQAVALAFWGPILAILIAADAPGGESEARRRLRTHLDHFRATHLAEAARPEERP